MATSRSYEELKELISRKEDLGMSREWEIMLGRAMLHSSDEALVTVIRSAATEYAARMAGDKNISLETNVYGTKEVFELLLKSMEGSY